MEHKSNPIIEGNVIFNKIDENGVIHIFLSSEFTLTTHWFYFKTISKDIGSERIIFSIDNATSSIFCKGWYNYSPFLSYNGKNWTRIDNGIVENNSYLFFIKNCHKDFFIAYYPPYQLETYREWLNKISSNFKNGKIIINNTLPDCIILGDHLKPSIIIVSRQHPGEVMASYVMEGFMDYLIRESISAIAILERFSIIVFPLLNKTGVEKDFHRFNASGIDLNRSWNKDNVEEILFVKNIINMYTSIHTVIDIHGDEISTFNYVYHKNNLNNTFLQALQKGCPQIVPLPRQSTLKRFIKQLIRNGKVLNIFKTSLADYAAKKYHAHSYTIEISARATDIEDCKKIGENIAEALLESLLFI